MIENIDDRIFEDSDSLEDLGSSQHNLPKTIQLSGMYQNWFLDYASYVILERAIPDILDGLKPVQRRLLHAMHELDDGRYNKVANIIGHTMKYHPHGDASIGDALVQLGQKDLLIDTQGNWGNIFTGDRAAAARYIEARLSKFALAVVFNEKTTQWKLSYDGRNKEPIVLPIKFPLLLAQGVDGIAVGLSSKILPHNFIELIDASINYIKGIETTLLPDFPTGGLADFSKYQDGTQGGRVRVRAKISQIDKKTLVITEIPFGTTTNSLIESIIKANDKGKIKIRKIEDNTAENVEILIHLMPGISPDQTIDALYLFTDCEVSISPNICVISNNKPVFLSVSELLAESTRNTIKLLTQELTIKQDEIEQQWHQVSLEKIFIEKRIYRDIEKAETWEQVLDTIEKGLKPHIKKLKLPVTKEDILRLTEIKIKRISKYDVNRADELLKQLEDELRQVKHHLDNIDQYTIDYFLSIKERFSKGKERKTEIKNFDTIEATRVAVANQKLYVNRAEGFVGFGLKRDEFVCDCSDLDDIITFRSDGTFMVTKVAEKTFVGKDIIHVAVFAKNDERTIYNMVYTDGAIGPVMVKRFAIGGVTRDKEYSLTKGTEGSKVLYFTANPNGEAEVINVVLRPRPRLKKLQFDFDFNTIAVKGRNSMGNILTRYTVKKITLKNEGKAQFNKIELFYDEATQRLNYDKRGRSLGLFNTDDQLICFMQSGTYRTYQIDISIHFDEDMILIEKFNPNTIYSAIYWEGETQTYYLKRFQAEPTERKQLFIGEHEDSKLKYLLNDELPRIELVFDKNRKKPKDNELVLVADFIGVKNFKAKGKRLSAENIEDILILDPIIVEKNNEDELALLNDTDINEEQNQDFQLDNEDNNLLDDENGQIKLNF